MQKGLLGAPQRTRDAEAEVDVNREMRRPKC